MSDNITYTFPVGGERFSKKACYLTKSIKTFSSSPDIVTYLLPEERETVPGEQIEFLEKNTTLIEGERPISGYPISAKHGAFLAGSRHSDRTYIAHIDTDALLLNDFDLPNSSNIELYMKPVDMGFLYWGQEESYPDWKVLYAEKEMEFPGPSIRSDIDSKPIPPLYNAGFIIAKNGEFAEDWLETTIEVFKKFPEQRYSDQVALGLLSHKYSVQELTMNDSYLVPGYYWCPSDVGVLRYQSFSHLFRIPNIVIRKKLSKIGLSSLNIASEEDDIIKSIVRQVSRIPFYRISKLREYYGVPFSHY